MSFLDDLFGGGNHQQVRFAPGCTNDQKQVFNMLKPHPAILVDRPRKLVRHGVLTYYSPNTNSTKPRYFFLFNDCLLVTKRKSSSKYKLRVFIHLRSNIRLFDLRNAREFRLVVPTSRGNRNVIMFAQNAEHKRAWVRDLMHCLWVRGGKIGPDPSGITPYTGPHLSPEEMERLRAEQMRRDEAEMRNQGNFFGDSDDEGSAPQSRPVSAQRAPTSGGSAPAPVAAYRPPAQAAPSSGYTVAGKTPATTAPAATTAAAAGGGSAMFDHFDPFADNASGNTGGSSDLLGLNDFDPFASTPGVTDDPTIDWGSDPILGGFASSSTMDGLGAMDFQGTGAAGGSAADRDRLLAAGMGTANAMKGMMASDAAAAAAAGTSAAGADASSSLTAEELALQAKIEREADQALRDATAAIEEVTRRLGARPRRAPQPVDSPVTMDEVSDALMDGVEAVARAATALMVASTAAQAERLQLGAKGMGIGGAHYHADPQWSNGLISAARQVVATTKYMVQVADDVANGRADYESLSASVHAVTASTTQMVTAQRAKSDPNSEASKSLESAAKGITRATRALVDQVADIAAQQRAAAAQPAQKDDYSLSMDQVREIQAQARALKLEEDARRAREELAELRKQKYNH